MLRDINIYEACVAGATVDGTVPLPTLPQVANPVAEIVNGITIFRFLPFSNSLLFTIKGYYPFNINVYGHDFLRMKLNLFGATVMDSPATYLPNNTEIYFATRKTLDKKSIEIPGSRMSIADWNHIAFSDQDRKEYKPRLVSSMPSITLKPMEILECWVDIPEVGAVPTNYPQWDGVAPTPGGVAPHNAWELDFAFCYFRLKMELTRTGSERR